VAVLGLLDLAAHGRDEHVALQRDALERAQRRDVAGERALHVRDAEAVEPAVLDERTRLEAGHAREPRLLAGVRRVHVTVEHERRPAADTLADAENVRAPVLDLLPLHLEAQLAKGLG